jgi:thiamine biosynthesis protein ThiI
MNAEGERVILLRYGELYLKGGNRPFFEQTLIRNVKAALRGIEYRFEETRGRYIVSEYAPGTERELCARLRCVSGLHSYSTALRVTASLDAICAAALGLAPDTGTFKCVCNRADKSFPLTSPAAAGAVGEFILSHKPALSVDLSAPRAQIFIDIRETGFAYVYGAAETLTGGLPVGTGGRALVLLSGGIDSPVAAYMMAKRGMRVEFAHFHSYPYTSPEAREKVVALARKLVPYTGDTALHTAGFTEIQEAIHAHCDESYMITVTRRFMLRTACAIARKTGAQALVTGESLGQVASQTVESITVTNAAASLPVLRPLIGMDKSEIIDIARRIGTYDISILPYEDCCTVFLPKKPVIRPTTERAEKEESKLNAEDLLARAECKTEKITGDPL